MRNGKATMHLRLHGEQITSKENTRSCRSWQSGHHQSLAVSRLGKACDMVPKFLLLSFHEWTSNAWMDSMKELGCWRHDWPTKGRSSLLQLDQLHAHAVANI